MATVNGTTSQNSSKYDFYIEYEKGFNPTKMEWVIDVKVYLRVNTYKYSGNTSHSLVIGGTTVDKETDYKKTCGNSSSSVSYLIAAGTKKYAALSKDREVLISATMSAPSGGYGPGTCKCSKTITLEAKLVAGGEFAEPEMQAHTVDLKLKKLTTGLGYTRTVKFYYKLTTANTWTLAGTVNVASYKSVAEVRVYRKLLPAKKYNFKATVLSPTGAVIKTLTASGTTINDLCSFVKTSATTTSIKLSVKDLTDVIGLKRILKLYYRRKGATSWNALSGLTKTYDAQSKITSPVFNIQNLEAGVAYQFKLDVVYPGNYVGISKTLTAPTKASVASPEEGTLNISAEFDDSKESLCITITDTRVLEGGGAVAVVPAVVYLGSGDMPYECLGIINFRFYQTSSYLVPLTGIDVSKFVGECTVKIVCLPVNADTESYISVPVADIYQISFEAEEEN